MINKILQKVDYLLKNANFETLVFEQFTNKKKKFCFDLLVKKDKSIFIVKLFPNIDNLNKNVINDIKALSLLLKSKPLIIGIKNRYQNLEDNTIYLREDLPIITLNTLENILNLNLFPHILARRGGGVIFLDGNLMKTLREQKNISRTEMSTKLGVTKRTVCSYENENMRPSEKIATKILDLLEDSSLFKKINIFEWNIKFSIDQKDLFEESELSSFESHLQDIIEDIGISSYWYKKGQVPFKLSLYSQVKNLDEEDNFYPLFSGVSDEQNKINEFNLKCLEVFTNLFQKRALLIVNNDLRIPEAILKKNIPIIKIKSLEKIDNEEDFIEFIQESGR